MKNLIKILACIILTFSFCIAINADSSVQNVRAAIISLNNGDVSYEWKNDVKAHRENIQEIEATVLKLSQSELSELSDIKTDIIGFISALYSLDGKPTDEIENLFNNLTPATNAKKSTGARNSALEIYNTLLASDVSPAHQPDIAKNQDLITQMLDFTYLYTQEDLAAVTLQERLGMMQYFKALYSMLNYDTLSLETVLSSVTQPINLTSELPAARQALTNYQTANNDTTPKTTPAQNSQSHLDSKLITKASTVIVFSICFSIAALLVLFLKKRDEYKHFKF